MSRTDSRSSDHLSNVSRSHEDRGAGGKSKRVVNRNSERHAASGIGSRRDLVDYHGHEGTIKPATRLSKFLEHLSLNKGKILPLAILAVPSMFLFGESSVTHAASISGMMDSVQQVSGWFQTLNDVAKAEILQPQNNMKELMIWVYKMISMIIYTPAFLFDNEFFQNMIRFFSGLSIGVVTIGSMIEGFKRVIGLSGTSIKQIMTRLPLMVAICGFAPIGFVKAVEAMNGITNTIFYIGTNVLGNTTTYPDMWEFNLFGDTFEAIGFFLFILLYIALLIPMMLHHGRRWFSMIALGVLTPFAMLGYVFDSFKSFHTSWWSTLKGLFLVQIVYSVFVTILSLLMFAVPFPTTIEGLFAKLLVILGGLYMLAIPPPFVRKFFDQGPSPKQSYTLMAKKIGKLMLKKI